MEKRGCLTFADKRGCCRPEACNETNFREVEPSILSACCSIHHTLAFCTVLRVSVL